MASTNSKKKLEEKCLKILRELASMTPNKECFDCHQRGPTYINMTIGSFVCTTCSGMLRGLNPPHRVKSISMASFSQDEIDFIKSRGNEVCRKIWLGLYDPSTHLEPETRDESRIKDFMVLKYEKKRFFVEPTAIQNSVNQLGNTSAVTVSPPSNRTTISSTTPGIKPLTLAFPKDTFKPLIVKNDQFKMNPPPVIQSNKPQKTDSLVDPFGDNGDLFGSNTKTSLEEFANFDNNPEFKNNSLPSQTVMSNPTNSFVNSTQKLANSLLPSSLTPNNADNRGGNGNGVKSPPAADRYAALAELDTVFKTQNQTSSSNQISESSENESSWKSDSFTPNTTSSVSNLGMPDPNGFSAYAPISNPSSAGFSNQHPGSFSMMNGFPNSVMPNNPAYPYMPAATQSNPFAGYDITAQNGGFGSQVNMGNSPWNNSQSSNSWNANFEMSGQQQFSNNTKPSVMPDQFSFGQTNPFSPVGKPSNPFL